MQPTRLVSGKQQVFSPFATKWSLGLQLSKHEFEEKNFITMKHQFPLLKPQHIFQNSRCSARVPRVFPAELRGYFLAENMVFFAPLVFVYTVRMVDDHKLPKNSLPRSPDGDKKHDKSASQLHTRAGRVVKLVHGRASERENINID